LAIFARKLLAITTNTITIPTFSKLLILGEVALKASVLHSDDYEADDGDYGEDANYAADDGPDDAATSALGLLDALVIEKVGVAVTLGLDIRYLSVDTVDGELRVFVIEDDIEVLHEDVTEDVLELVDAVTIDTNLANVLAILVGSLDQIVLRLDDVGAVTHKVEAKVAEVLGLAHAVVVA